MTNLIYVLIRKDLDNSQRVVQSGHAVIEVAQDNEFSEHPSIIVLGVSNESELKNAINRIEAHGLRPYPFSDSYFGELTSVGFYVDKFEDRSVFKKYKLLHNNSFRTDDKC
jgi:hypothetical protein